jgi:hypothetical protein
MAKKNEVAVVTPPTDIAIRDSRPAFLSTTIVGAGTEGLANIVRPSFVKIVQKNSSDELLDKFGIGAIILTPDMLQLAPPEGTLSFVPILHFVEFCKWSPMKLRNTEPMIVERSFDRNSSVAKKATNSKLWREDHPHHVGDKDYSYRYVEHLNFLIKPSDPESRHLDPMLVSFCKTGYSAGQRLGKLILNRKADIYACQFSLGTRTREGAENKWKVFTVENHEQPWVTDEDVFNQCKDLHDFAFELLRKKQLDMNYEADVVDDADVVDGEVVGTGQY